MFITFYIVNVAEFVKLNIFGFFADNKVYRKPIFDCIEKIWAEYCTNSKKGEPMSSAKNGLVNIGYSSCEPIEAIIKMYNWDYCIQQIVNTLMDQGITNYSYQRIAALLQTYLEMKQQKKKVIPSEVEMNEPDIEYEDAVRIPVSFIAKDSFEYIFDENDEINCIEATVKGVDNEFSVGRLYLIFKENGIKTFSEKRIKKIASIYNDLRKEKRYNQVIDVELEEIRLSHSCKVPAAKTKSKANEKVCAENLEQNEDVDDEVLDSEEIAAETESPQSEISEELVEEIVEDPLPIFRLLNSQVTLVAQKLSPALLVTGPGGVGKSYAVEQVLSRYGKKNEQFVIMKGKCTASAMFEFLFKNYDKICVFDDCDSVLSSKEGLAILKGALDSGKSRDISWTTKRPDMVDTFGCTSRKEIMKKLKDWSRSHSNREGVPTHFQFRGSIIFISNMNREELLATDASLVTRCDFVEVSVTREDMLQRIEALLPEIKIYNANGTDITRDKPKQDVFKWISSPDFLEDPRMEGKPVDFRLFIKAYKARFAKLPEWKEMAFSN